MLCTVNCRGFSISARYHSSRLKNIIDNIASLENTKHKNSYNKWTYSEESNIRRNQSLKRVFLNIDPKETSIILFPGQGSQYVGMGRNLIKYPGALDLFKLASEVLKYDLLKICLEGPIEILQKTIHCQAAVMVTSLAALEKLKEERPKAIENCVATAGFSLGEITALVFAGSIPFDKALKLVQVRAESMQLASEQNPGGMATVLYGPDSDLGLACEKAKIWCLKKGVINPECRIANYLYPHCKVIAGSLEALKYLESNAKTFKLRRIKKLPVNGAFHTNLMETAVEPFTKILKNIKIDDPLISVHSNIDGMRYKNASHIIRQLPKQIVRAVKWEQTTHILYERKQGSNFPRTFECGPGKGLTAILKQNNAKAFDAALNIET